MLIYVNLCKLGCPVVLKGSETTSMGWKTLVYTPKTPLWVTWLKS